MNFFTIILMTMTFALPSGGSSQTLPACPTIACTAYEMNNKKSQTNCLLPDGTVSCVISAPWSTWTSYCSPKLAGYKC